MFKIGFFSKQIGEKMVKEKKELYHKPEDLEKKISDWTEPCFSEAGISILNKRYLDKDESGKVVESPKEMLYRVAHIVGQIDSNYGDYNPNETEREFYELMASGKFLPNSPTLKGAGLNINLSACYVVPIEDSREGIFKEALFNSVEIQAYGGGTGFNFSTLRAKGSSIKSTKGKSSGPISFMKIFDKAIGETIAQGGTRQGANMGILRVNHPDIEQFITCKEKEGELTNFNISVGVTEDFMRKAISGEDYDIIDHTGKIVGKKNAKAIFDKIVNHAWKKGDPGIIYIDRINQNNPTPDLGTITATNPCGEQPLLDLEACNLGSVNLRQFVNGKEIKWDELENTIYSAIHFLDNVIDANKFPLEKTEKEKKELEKILSNHVKEKEIIESIIDEYSLSPIEKSVKGNRKIGLGVMGFADMINSMGIGYGSEESYEIAEKVMEFIHKKSQEASVKLAESRGTFPNWKGSIYDPDSKNFLGEFLKLRNACVSTIAPTGTISTLLGVSGGIEPQFAVAYIRKSDYDENGVAKIENFIVDREFEKLARTENFFTPELLDEISENKGSLLGVRKPKNISSKRWAEIKDLFLVANDLTYDEHIRMQDAFQRHVDNAISKTINLPEDADEETIRKAYLMTLETSVKGITVYRDGTIENQTLSAKRETQLKNGERPIVIGTTVKQKTPLGNAFITLNVLKDDFSVPYEAFITIGKGGKDIDAIAEGYGRMASLSFKRGVKIEEMAEQLHGINGESMTGLGPNKVSSIPDAFAKGLIEAYSQINNKKTKLQSTELSGNFCPTCGSKMMMVEGCQKCTNPSCGYSKC